MHLIIEVNCVVFCYYCTYLKNSTLSLTQSYKICLYSEVYTLLYTIERPYLLLNVESPTHTLSHIPRGWPNRSNNLDDKL